MIWLFLGLIVLAVRAIFRLTALGVFDRRAIHDLTPTLPEARARLERPATPLEDNRDLR